MKHLRFSIQGSCLSNHSLKLFGAGLLVAIASMAFSPAQAQFTVQEPVFSAPAAVKPADSNKAETPPFTPSVRDLSLPAVTQTAYPSPAEWEHFYQLVGGSSCSSCNSGSQTIAVGVNVATTETINAGDAYKALGKTSARAVAGGNLVSRSADRRLVISRRINAPGAVGLRLHLTDFNLQGGGELYLFSDLGETFGPYSGTGLYTSGEFAGQFWTNTIYADHLNLEVRFPASATEADIVASTFTISEIGYIVGDGSSGNEAERSPRLASCIVDASCYSASDFSKIDDLRNAIGQMLYSKTGGQYVCTGGLVNTLVYSGIPYFLTANHCLSTPAEAASLEVTWQFKTTACNVGFKEFASRIGFPRTLGSELLATGKLSASPDFTFLRLSQDPPVGSVFLGWNSAPVPAGVPLYRISHPKGSQQAYSSQVTVGQGSGVCTILPTKNFIYSNKSIGAPDGGSSGSPVVNSSNQIVGQLYGRCGYNLEDVCAPNDYVVDGRFSVTFPQIKTFLGVTGVEPTVTNFFYSPYPAQAGQATQFHASAKTPDNNPLTYVYDYGDGVLDSLGTHTYSTEGTYLASVTVVNGTASVTAMMNVKVLNKAPIITSFTYSPNPVYELQNVNFNVTANSPESLPLTYSYAYGDGASDATAIHPYADAGNYTVTVSVTDGTYTSTSSTVVSVSPATMPDLAFLSSDVLLSAKGKKGTLSGELMVVNQSKIPSPATEIVLTLNEPGSGTVLSELKRYSVPALGAGESYTFEPGREAVSGKKGTKYKPVKIKLIKGAATGKNFRFTLDAPGVIAEMDESNNAYENSVVSTGK